jgi:hypothetical protein
MDRFTAVRQHFRQTRRFRGDPSQVAKGLAFVQLYAIYEYTVNNVVRVAASEIAAHSHPISSLRPSLMALFLDPEFSSVRDCSPARLWEQRIALCERVISDKPAAQYQSPIPMDGTHYRHTHVKLILKVFGIARRPTRRRRHLFRIDEVVQNRNSIAHGEETASEIGRRYSRQDIFTVTRQMESACLRLIMLFEEHCSLPERHRR